jgi:hypothetical protein
MKKISVLIMALLCLSYYPVSAMTPLDYMHDAIMRIPGMGQCYVGSDAYHLVVDITPNALATPKDMNDALCAALGNYIAILDEVPDYNGYLQIIVHYGGETAVLQCTASDARQSEIDNTQGYLLYDMVQGRQAITYYWADRYGDVTKDAILSNGERLSPAVGDWLG